VSKNPLPFNIFWKNPIYNQNEIIKRLLLSTQMARKHFKSNSHSGIGNNKNEKQVESHRRKKEGDPAKVAMQLS